MIRFSEMVLPGHPDKFCDQVADEIVAECYRVDAEAYCQVEVSCWSDEIWLTGGIVTRKPLLRSLEDVVRAVGREIGYVEGNAIVADRYQLNSSVCVEVADPTPWTHHVNDQCISIGWAGYDSKVRYLPPEHFLAHGFREALARSFRGGRLRRQGPDGKLLVRLRESSDEWAVEHVLVTLQHLEATRLEEICAAVDAELASCYRALQRADSRWRTRWDDIELLVNPNGPLINGGSDGDNGQTGPRVAIGGGALSGKDLTHIDRAAAYAARQAAVHAAETGAGECRVILSWAPNLSQPLDVVYEMEGRGERWPAERFSHGSSAVRAAHPLMSGELGRGTHFYDDRLPWNREVVANYEAERAAS